MTESSGFLTKSMNLPVKPLNAATFAAAEIAYEDGIAVFAKITWSPYDAPR